MALDKTKVIQEIFLRNLNKDLTLFAPLNTKIGQFFIDSFFSDGCNGMGLWGNWKVSLIFRLYNNNKYQLQMYRLGG